MTTRQRFIPVLLLLFAIAGCAGSGQWLNSDRIERQFGSYGVDVLAASETRRVSSLYSGTGDQRTTRTYAVVEFYGRPRSAIDAEHQLIMSGRSIGKTFRDGGWSIRKQHLFIGAIEVPPAYSGLAGLMRIALPETLAVHQYLFIVTRDDRSFTYATITEVHHPEYLGADDLRRIYGEILFDDSNRDSIHDFIGAPLLN